MSSPDNHSPHLPQEVGGMSGADSSVGSPGTVTPDVTHSPDRHASATQRARRGPRRWARNTGVVVLGLSLLCCVGYEGITQLAIPEPVETNFNPDKQPEITTQHALLFLGDKKHGTNVGKYAQSIESGALKEDNLLEQQLKAMVTTYTNLHTAKGIEKLHKAVNAQNKTFLERHSSMPQTDIDAANADTAKINKDIDNYYNEYKKEGLSRAEYRKMMFEELRAKGVDQNQLAILENYLNTHDQLNNPPNAYSENRRVNISNSQPFQLRKTTETVFVTPAEYLNELSAKGINSEENVDFFLERARNGEFI